MVHALDRALQLGGIDFDHEKRQTEAASFAWYA
jgi:hypothetical protein